MAEPQPTSDTLSLDELLSLVEDPGADARDDGTNEYGPASRADDDLLRLLLGSDEPQVVRDAGGVSASRSAHGEYAAFALRVAGDVSDRLPPGPSYDAAGERATVSLASLLGIQEEPAPAPGGSAPKDEEAAFFDLFAAFGVDGSVEADDAHDADAAGVAVAAAIYTASARPPTRPRAAGSVESKSSSGAAKLVKPVARNVVPKPGKFASHPIATAVVAAQVAAATSSAVSAKRAAGKPAASAVQVAAMSGKPEESAGKSAASVGKPAPDEKPAVKSGSPTEKPASLSEKPAALTGKPVAPVKNLAASSSAGIKPQTALAVVTNSAGSIASPSSPSNPTTAPANSSDSIATASVVAISARESAARDDSNAAYASNQPAGKPEIPSSNATEESYAPLIPAKQPAPIASDGLVVEPTIAHPPLASEAVDAGGAASGRKLVFVGMTFVAAAALLGAAALAVALDGGKSIAQGEPSPLAALVAGYDQHCAAEAEYAYKVRAADGSVGQVAEKAVFGEDGFLMKSELSVRFDTEEQANAFLEEARGGFGASLLDGRVDGSLAFIAVDAEGEPVDRAAYTELLLAGTIDCEVVSEG